MLKIYRYVQINLLNNAGVLIINLVFFFALLFEIFRET